MNRCALALAPLLLAAMPAFAGLESCLKIVEREFGKQCGSPRSMAIKMRNECNQTLAASLCLQTVDGKPSCGANLTMRPGHTVYNFSCNATGKYVWDVCTEADWVSRRCKLMDASQINWNQR